VTCSTEDIDRAAMREKVSRWLDEHPDGTVPAAIEDLSPGWPDQKPRDLAIVLGFMVRDERAARRR
jgi:hypothetical protein